VHIIGHACLRALQLVRAPTLLHDYHLMENALGGRPPERPPPRQRRLPARWRDRAHRFALERGFLDTLLGDYIVRPFLKFFAWCDAIERHWTRLLSGRGAAEPVVQERPGGVIDELR
jgi:NAD(P)H-quinone oxidoreductase subunit 5